MKKDTWMGGKYGTTVNINYSGIHDSDKQPVNDTTGLLELHTLGYKSDFFKIGKTVFFKDFNLEII